MTSAGGISATTAGVKWATGHLTSTGSLTKASLSPTNTASRVARPDAPRFITGQNPVRTGLTKVGLPGANLGLMKEDPTIAELLKPLGYATGQFDKNHFGDKTSFCRPCTASTSSSQSLPPQCPGRTGTSGLSQEPRVQETLRPERRTPLLGRRQRRSEDRGYRISDQEAHGNHR